MKKPSIHEHCSAWGESWGIQPRKTTVVRLFLRLFRDYRDLEDAWFVAELEAKRTRSELRAVLQGDKKRYA